MTVAALYVDTARGPYASMPDIDAWGEERDARLYRGPWSVIAHPPCGHWCKLRWNCKQPEAYRAMGPHAVSQLRAWGGVLEHPESSLLWRTCGMPRPSDPPDTWGGYSVVVDQVHFGHPCRKRTWLYIVGCPRPHAVAILSGLADYSAKPTHAMGVPAHKGRVLPCLPKTQRHITPQRFADALARIAMACTSSEAQVSLWRGR